MEKLKITQKLLETANDLEMCFESHPAFCESKELGNCLLPKVDFISYKDSATLYFLLAHCVGICTSSQEEVKFLFKYHLLYKYLLYHYKA